MVNHRPQSWIKLIIGIIICLLAGYVGSLFTRPAIPGWYAALHKPSFIPPSGVFGPVWTCLYVLMGVALFLVWRAEKYTPRRRAALAVFALQLVLNILWSILFFGLRSPLAGLVDIICLWLTIIMTILLFFRISKSAAALLIPYLLWVSFAAVLNAAIILLNT